MNLSRNRSKLVTYSRAKRKSLHDDDGSLKRRRVQDAGIHLDEDTRTVENVGATSSPLSEQMRSDNALFSDENQPISSPPSSPPPAHPSVEQPADDTTSQAPLDIVTEKRPDALSSLQRHSMSKPKKKPLVQMQLNLGQSFQKRCRTCGMEFVPSSPEDAALHQKYHRKNNRQNIDGVHIGRDFLKKAEGWGGIEWHGNDGEDRIISISRHWRCQSGRQYVMPVLDVVQAELGAVDIPYNLLWSLCYTKLPSAPCTGAKDPEVRVETVHGPCFERYKVYLYVHGTRCVGLCLTERISKGYKVVEPKSSVASPAALPVDTDRDDNVQDTEQGEPIVPDADAPITVAEAADDVWMGVSRIWVSSGFRKKGIASALLDAASKTFREKRKTPKELVAFSQPTQAGAHLARQWFGRPYEWHVYKDCNSVLESEKGNWYSRRDDELVKA